MALLTWSRRSQDLALGVLLTALAEGELLLLDRSAIGGSLGVHLLLNLLIVPAVALRRVAPLISVLIAAAGLALTPVAGSTPVATPFLVLLFLLGSLGWYASTRTGLVGVGATVVGGLGLGAFTGDMGWADVVVNAVIIVLAWALLHVIRRFSDQRLEAILEADRKAQAAVLAERNRIAHDLHDSLAHALTLITLQAGSARERTAEPATISALASIESAGRDAVADMHRFLELIGPRDGDAPGLADLPELVEGVRRSGLDVDLSVSVGELPASTETLVFRIVQEGLTNVVRHSDARHVDVTIRGQEAAVVVAVRDDGTSTGTSTAGSRRGLAGLRERLALFDAAMTAGPDGGGWRLEARIPVASAVR